MGVLNYYFPKCDFSHVFAVILLFNCLKPVISHISGYSGAVAPGLVGMMAKYLLIITI